MTAVGLFSSAQDPWSGMVLNKTHSVRRRGELMKNEPWKRRVLSIVGRRACDNKGASHSEQDTSPRTRRADHDLDTESTGQHKGNARAYVFERSQSVCRPERCRKCHRHAARRSDGVAPQTTCLPRSPGSHSKRQGRDRRVMRIARHGQQRAPARVAL